MPYISVVGTSLDVALDAMVGECEHSPVITPQALVLMRLAAEMIRMQQVRITALEHALESQTKVLQGGLSLVEQMTKKIVEDDTISCGVLYDVYDILHVLKQGLGDDGN